MSTSPLQTLDFFLNKFNPLLDGLASLVEAVAHPSVNKIPAGQEWRHSGQVLMIKAYHHLRSIRTLADGVKIGVVVGTSDDNVYIDHGSMAALGRAALEAYATFYFIFGDGSAEDQLFRYRIWKMQGLRKRRALIGFASPDLRVEAVREDDLAAISDLRQKIEADLLFSMLTKDEQGKTIKGDSARLGRSLPAIATDAGLPSRYANDMYNHFSEYAHSGAVSTFQIYDAMHDGSGPKLAGLTIGFCSVLLTLMLTSYADQFPAAEAALHANVDLFEHVVEWTGYIDRLYTTYGEPVPD